ncbi:choice-of-anchor X domain-containing protein [Streptomyces bungoensis]|uniref:choice-of-anchor X domain-containing protein n=1 Tax=Streptomyces bungoensis TaxID=285568 RepID=UPI0036A48E17
MRRALVPLLTGAAMCAALLAPAGRDPAPAADSRPAFPAVNYAVAVDESASLRPEDMKAEKAAAARIALGDVSADSHVSVFGFAAAEAAGQKAVDVACPRTALDTAGRDTIGACVGRLHSRTRSEGTGTDFPNAIRQGVHDLTDGTDASQPRVLFLLTDGYMDVTDSPQYGDPAHREAEGRRQLGLALKEAAAHDVQIWPLGFGSAPRLDELKRMAAGGYQKGCVDLPSARPKPHKVDPEDIGSTLEDIFAAAHCLRHERGPSRTPPATLKIAISPLATVGSIVVDKGDPQVRITYYDPSGAKVPTHGTYKHSGFELAGGNGPVEALKIVDPLPGTWKVKAEAPEGHRSLPVAVSVLWQGELRGALTMDPPSPQAGERATVTMRLQTREGYAVKDPRDYAGLRVRGELTGHGFGPLALDLTDDGKAPDPTAGDGSFTASVRIPRAADDDLTLSATLTASGLRGDTRSLTTGVAPGQLPVTTSLDLPPANVHPGDKVTGSLAVHNTSSTAHTLRLAVTDLRGGLLSLGPDRITVPPGESGTRDVTVEVAPAGVFGDRLGDGLRLAGTVTVVDTTDHDRMLVREPLSVRVTPRPGIWDQYWWAFAAGAVALLAIAALAAALVRHRRRVRDPYGLTLQLVAEDGSVLSEHPAGHGQKQWYEFTVAEPHRSPRIERRSHGPYAVQRNPKGGGAVLRKKGGGRTLVPVRGPVPLTETLQLALGEDKRPPKRRKDNRRQPTADRREPRIPDDSTSGTAGTPSAYSSYE